MLGKTRSSLEAGRYGGSSFRAGMVFNGSRRFTEDGVKLGRYSSSEDSVLSGFGGKRTADALKVIPGFAKRILGRFKTALASHRARTKGTSPLPSSTEFTTTNGSSVFSISSEYTRSLPGPVESADRSPLPSPWRIVMTQASSLRFILGKYSFSNSSELFSSRKII